MAGRCVAIYFGPPVHACCTFLMATTIPHPHRRLLWVVLGRGVACCCQSLSARAWVHTASLRVCTGRTCTLVPWGGTVRRVMAGSNVARYGAPEQSKQSRLRRVTNAESPVALAVVSWATSRAGGPS